MRAPNRAEPSGAPVGLVLVSRSLNRLIKVDRGAGRVVCRQAAVPIRVGLGLRCRQPVLGPCSCPSSPYVGQPSRGPERKEESAVTADLSVAAAARLCVHCCRHPPAFACRLAARHAAVWLQSHKMQDSVPPWSGPHQAAQEQKATGGKYASGTPGARALVVVSFGPERCVVTRLSATGAQGVRARQAACSGLWSRHVAPAALPTAAACPCCCR